MADSPDNAPRVRDRIALAIDVLGPVTATAEHPDGRRVPVDLTNRKSRALMGFLAIHDQKSVSRERLAGLLWCDVEAKKAHGSLRNALYEMRDALTRAGYKGLTGEEHDKLGVTIHRDHLSVDLIDIFDGLGRGEIHHLLLERDRIFESLFEDVRIVDEEFHTFTRTKQASFKRRAIEGLEDIMRAEATTADLRERSARAISRLDPSHEEAARTRMRAHAEAGDTGAAQTIYKELFDHLAFEHDGEPSNATQELNAAIVMGRISAAALPAEASALHLKAGVRLVIGVCPFNLAGIPPASHYLVQGFRAELINSLVHFRDWSIYESPQAFTPGISPPGQAGEYLLGAAGTEAGDEVRLVVMVHDAQTGQIVCSERLHVSKTNWFASQDQVIRRLSRQLNVNISEDRLRATERGDIGQEPIAFDVWLKHDRERLGFDPERWLAAETVFKRLIQQHPEFSRSHSSLAAMYNTRHYAFPGVFRDMGLTEQSIALCRTATRLDALDTHGHQALGYAYALAHQFELAEAQFRLVLELNENNPWGSVSAAAGLGLCGHVDESLDRIKAALEHLQAPTPSMWGYFGITQLYAGHYEGSVAASARAKAIPLFHATYAASLALAGDIPGARAEFAELVQKLSKGWMGPAPVSQAGIAEWLAHGSPVKQIEHWNHLRAGLERAGGDTRACRHRQWQGYPIANGAGAADERADD